MTGVMQMSKPPDTLQEWRTIFPDFTTLSGSSLFIKKLMAVSLSSITYIRGVFPANAYGERNLCGIKLKLLTEDSGFDGVDKFINLIRSCYDAVEKQYLHQLSIGICTDLSKRDEVVESFNLSFRYKDDEFSVTCNNKTSVPTENDPTVSATLFLLKGILTMTDILQPLPKNAYLTMKLLYNEITPPEYEPPGFEPCENDKFKFSSNTVKLELGRVSTDMHGYKMYLKTAMSCEPLYQCLEESVLTGSQKSTERAVDDIHDIPEPLDPKPNAMEKNGTDIIVSSPGQSGIECPCKCRQDLDMDTVQCTVCEKKQHSICYGILKAKDKPFKFYCVQCIADAPFTNSPIDLIHSEEGENQRELCALRRTLVYCSSLKYITLLQIEKKLGCKKELAKDLLERLEFEGFIKKAGNKKYSVNEKKIKNFGYKEYFLKNDDELNQSNTMKQQKDERLNSSNKSLPESQPTRKSTRRSLQQDDDSYELFQSQPKRRRCMSTREEINLNK